MRIRFLTVLLAAVAVVPTAAREASAGGKFTLIADAACVSSAGYSQGFVWWSGKDPSRAYFTFQPSGETREMEITRLIRSSDSTNLADFGIANSSSVDIVLTDRRGNPLASVSGVPCGSPP